jgi:hypothetical protein
MKWMMMAAIVLDILHILPLLRENKKGMTAKTVVVVLLLILF